MITIHIKKQNMTINHGFSDPVIIYKPLKNDSSFWNWLMNFLALNSIFYFLFYNSMLIKCHYFLKLFI